MNRKALQVVGCVSALVHASCSPPLDLCGPAVGACLTVQANADSTDPVDLLRALYTVGTDSQKEQDFMSPPGGSPLPAGFQLNLLRSGDVNLQVVAERNLRPSLRGSAQLTIGDNEHQNVTVALTPDLQNLPYFGPPPRHHAGMVYFPSRKAVVLFGGIGSDGTALGDTWELQVESGSWTPYAAGGPGPSARVATLAYDQTQKRVVLAGGADPSGAATQDLWFYDAEGRWSPAALTNHGGGNRIGAGMTVTDNGVMVIAGGIEATGKTILQDVQTYGPGASKIEDFVPRATLPMLPPVKTPKLVSASSVLPLSEVYLLGADEATPNSSLAIWQIKGLFSSTLSTLAVSQVALGDSAAPSRRTDFAVCADASAGLIYLFGGTAPTGEYLQDAYVFSVATKQWARVSAMPTPLARAGAQLSLLPTAVLLFGGLAPAGSATPVALDNWKLTTNPFNPTTLSGAFVRHP